MSEPLAWITGAGGLIGYHLVQSAEARALDWNVRGLTRKDLDLTDFAAVRQAFKRDKPALVIHCAAMSKSPACEKDPSLAHRINVEATRLLAQLAADIPFVFFSTDLVFDGSEGNYDESATPNPLSVYARTKAEAERVVLASPKNTVIRTSLTGGGSPTGDRGFNEEMRRAWMEGRTLTFFTDEFRSPIPVIVTACAIWELIAANRPGLYHLAGSERLSRWQIGQLLAARWPEIAAKMIAGSLKDYHGAPRSPDTSLNCAKIQKLLSFPLPAFSEWLKANPNEPF